MFFFFKLFKVISNVLFMFYLKMLIKLSFFL